MNYNYVDPIQWIVYGGIISAVLCVGIAILWVETQKEKWIESGRELGLEDREVKFKKTSGTRRVKKQGHKSPDLVVFEQHMDDIRYRALEVLRGGKPPKLVVKQPKSKRERTK